MSVAPTGTVTFLLTDIEGSTRHWEQCPEAMCPALARHDNLLRRSIEDNGGWVFKTVGDAFCAAFSTANSALEAALAAQLVLHAEPWELPTPLLVRMALHTGACEERGGDYFGPPLNRLARLMATGHGGQILLSGATQELAQPCLPNGVSLRDMAAHRLKDLQQPEHVFQLVHPALPGDFPPLRSLQAFANNLPLQMTSFVGRQRETQTITGLLSTRRLVTLTGAGGCGKTRLALQAGAETLERWGDGVWLVELAPLSDPSLVAQALASAVGVREEPGRSLTDTLTEYLRAKDTLLLLDNCEHLLGGCASLVQALLQTCPGVAVLATSREALGIPGEQPWRVPPLPFADPERLPDGKKDIAAALLGYDAVRLFVDRARVQKPDFVLNRGNAPAVAHVCRRLDGIPLALELAAARVRSLSVEEINARLDDRFRLLTGGSRMALPRQQTLRALIDWSYDLLTEGEKTLLRRLSVFAGGWTLTAAEEVCAGGGVEVAGIEDLEVLDLLTGLVDKSLVVYEEQADRDARYRLLETVRQYASDRLAEDAEVETLCVRHQRFFLSLVEETEPKLHGPEQTAHLDRLEDEQDNLRAALEWSAALNGAGSVESGAVGLQMAGALFWFWHLRGHISEGRRWLDSALTRAGAGVGGAGRARALQGAGQLAYYQSDYSAARILLEESGAIWRSLGDERSLAYSQVYLCASVHALKDYVTAGSVIAESVALARVCGDSWTLAMSLWMRGTFLHTRGDDAAARPLLEESVTLFREVSDRWALIAPLIYLAQIADNRQEFSGACALLEEAMRLSQAVGDRLRVSGTLDSFAHLALGQADASGTQERVKRAARLMGAASVLRRSMMASMPNVVKERHSRDMASARAALGEAAFAAAWGEGEAMTLEWAVEYALSDMG